MKILNSIFVTIRSKEQFKKAWLIFNVYKNRDSEVYPPDFYLKKLDSFRDNEIFFFYLTSNNVFGICARINTVTGYKEISYENLIRDY